jgi:carbamoyl-phosphate synthase large subunit
MTGSRLGNVLVTSASRKVPLVRAMKTAASKLDGTVKVVAGDLDPNALARFLADEFWAMPPTVPEQTCPLLDACKSRDIWAILPTRDGELAFWAEVRERFAHQGITVVVSDAESVERCLDKLEFARFGEEAGLPVIATAEHPESLGSGPYVVKERFGAGSRSLGLRLDRDAALAHGRQLERPIYQPFVEGPEISIDAWMDASGTPRGVVLRRRDHVVNGESQITTTFRDTQIEAEAVAALTALKLRGPAVMQAMIDTGGRMRIIECNARFGGASTTAIAAGLDMLYWSLLEACEPSAEEVFYRIEGEVRQVRVPADIILYDPDL